MSKSKKKTGKPRRSGGCEEESLHLHIAEGYAKGWGVWEGLREFVQNWHDGVLSTYEDLGGSEEGKVLFDRSETTYGVINNSKENNLIRYSAYCGLENVERRECLLECDSKVGRISLGDLYYDRMNQSVTMVNRKTSLGRCVFLLGHSKKAKREEVIGKFGEGLKLGALSLVRSGRKVVLCTGSERWRFGIDHLEERGFNQRVLTVHIKKRTTGESPLKGDFEDVLPPCSFAEMSEVETCTQVWSIWKDEWRDYSSRFLFLEKPTRYVETKSGTLILDEGYKGKLFVKRVWISDSLEEEMTTGVDLNDIELDRDRQACIDISRLEHSLSCLWVHSVKEEKELADHYCDLLCEKSKSREVSCAEMYLRRFADKETCVALADVFFRRYGEVFPLADGTSSEETRKLRQRLGGVKIHHIGKAMHFVIEKAGRIPEVPQLPYQPDPAPLPPPKIVKREYKLLSSEDKDTWKRAMNLIKKFEPDYPFKLIKFFDEDYGEIWERGGCIEVPSWIFNRRKVHAKMSAFQCPAKDKSCICPATYLVANLLNIRRGKYQSLDEVVFAVISQVANEVHQKSMDNARKEGVNNKLGGRSHFHKEVLAKRELELERYMDGLQEELDRKVADYKRVEDSLQAELSKFQEKVHEGTQDLEAKKEEIRQQKKEEIEHLEVKFKHARMEACKKVKIPLNGIDMLKTNIKETEEQINEKRKEIASDQEQHEEDIDKKTVQVTAITNKLAESVGHMQELSDLFQQNNEAQLSEDSKLYKCLEDFRQACADLKDKNQCQVCKEDRNYAVVTPCQHLQLCHQCAKTLHKCPICKENINNVERVYLN